MNFFYTLTLLFIWNSAFSQQYLGTTTQKASLREDAEKTSELLDQLKPNSQLFIYDKEPTNDYYNVIDVATDQEGWVHKSVVKLIKPLSKNDRGVFAPTERTSGSECKIDVKNSTNLAVTVKIDAQYIYLEPGESKTINLSPGTYNYTASAPSVIPYFGDEDFRAGYKYSWNFYIKTTRTYSPKFQYLSKRKKKK